MKRVLLLLVVALLLVASVSASLSDNLVSYWAGDNATYEDPISGNDGTITGTTYNATGGIVGGAHMWVASESDQITIPITPSDLGANNFTWQYWLYVTDKTRTANAIMFDSGGSAFPRFTTWGSAEIIDYYMSAANYLVTADNALLSDTWQHVIITRGDDNFTLWVDGTRIEEEIYSTTFSSGYNFELGAWDGQTPADRWLDGRLDEVAYWSRQLSNAEIGELYNAGAGLAYPFLPTGPPVVSATYQIDVTDFFNNTALAGVNVSLSAGCDNVTDASGTAILNNETPGCDQLEGTETATLQLAPYHFNESTFSIPENGTADAGAFQIRRNISVNRVWDGAAIPTPYNIEVGGQNYSNGTDVYLRNGSSTVQFYKTSWYVHTATLTETEPLDGLANVTGAYNQLLNLTAQNAYSSAPLSSFNITTFALPFNTTSTELFLNSTKNTTYEIAVDSVGYQGDRFNVTTTEALVYNYSFQLWSANSVRVNIYDQDSGLTITENISVTVSGNSSEDTFTTTSGFLFVSNLTDGAYTFKLQNENYTLVSYPVVVADNSSQILNAYLSKSTGTVTFTILDFDSSAVIEGANIDMERQINASWTLVANKLSDITGRAQFPYTPAIQYRFTVTATGYSEKEFILDPVLFSSYNIRLERTTTVPSDEDYAGVSVSWSPTWYEANVTRNFSITFSSPEGLLTAYNFTLSYPGGSLSGSGSNVYGGTISPGEVPLGAAMVYDTVNLTYSYDTSIGPVRSFSVQYLINGLLVADSLEDLKDSTFGLGLLERVLIASLVVLMVGAVLASFTGAIGALAGIILIQGMMVYTGFLPLWSFLPGAAVAVVYIMRRSGA